MGKYYSQLGEDCLLAQFFLFKKNGFFVDVGAFDGVYLSNGYCFEQLGWSGVCIEALPEYFELCVKNRSRSKCYQVACLDRDRGMVEFRRDRSGLFSGVNTDENYAASAYGGMNVPFEGFRSVYVPSTCLNDVLCNVNVEIDFVSIDVEGAELQVLTGFDLERYRPRILVLEARLQEQRQVLDTYLGQHGYFLARSMAWNHFYVCNPDDARDLCAIAVTATLERPPHPLGRLYNRIGDAIVPSVQWPALS